MGYASPNTFKACVIGTAGVDCLTPPPPLPPALLKHRTRSAWNVPVVGSDKVTLYTGYRAVGSTFNPAIAVQAGTPSSTTNLVDNTELPDSQLNSGLKFTYSVTATFADGVVSDYSASKNATITPVNDRPLAVSNSYTMLWNKTLTAPSTGVPGVLDNDTDADSPAASLRAVLKTSPSHGTLRRLDGSLIVPGDSFTSFTYTPAKNFVGTDSFTYAANDGTFTYIAADGTSTTVPMSADSDPVTVTIVVNKK
jgi:hypothetical protein